MSATPRERKVLINMRAKSDLRDMIDSAAESLGMTRTRFMLIAAKREAMKVLSMTPPEPARPSTPREVA